MMNRRRTALVVITGAVAVVAWWLWPARPDPTPPPTKATEPAPSTPSRRAVGTRTPQRPSASPAAVDTAPPPPVPDTPAEQALDAAWPGQRWVRCPVSPDLTAAGATEGSALRFLPPFSGAPRALGVQVEGGELSAAVTAIEGEGLLQTGLRSVARLRWSGARDDDGWGSCSLSAVDRVTLGGIVYWPDGRPAAGQQVRPCEPDELVVTDQQGRFEADVPAWRTCRALALLAGPERFGVGPTVVVELQDQPVLDVELALPGADEVWDREGWLMHLDDVAANMEAAQAAVAALPTVFDRALDDPDLSTDARARIERMAASAQAQEDVVLERLDQLRDEGDPAADPGLWLSAW